ncbi:MAG: hypothetical protein ABIO80_06775 [Sphingomicrobium sp.]
MSQVQLAGNSERLPWLSDEPRLPPSRRQHGSFAAVIFAIAATAIAMAAVAGLAFWLGTRSAPPAGARDPAAGTSATVALPPAQPTEPEVRIKRAPQVDAGPAPIVRPAPQHELRIAAPPATSTAAPQTEATPARAPPPVTQIVQRPRVAPSTSAAPLAVWPARQAAGAYGRLVQIGAFGTRLQAKRGWWTMVRAYPGVSRLQAVVVAVRNSRGRTFYRFQIGTTSQAHSEVLCQRMHRIRLSCAVVGLPWKPRGVER